MVSEGWCVEEKLRKRLGRQRRVERKRTAVTPLVESLEKQLVLSYLCLILPPPSLYFPCQFLLPAQITQHLH